jgi:uncharacterized protein YlxW (UPF0749 family)
VTVFTQIAGGAAVLITAFCGVAVGIFARRGSKEQNETSREARIDTKNDKFIENLQEDNTELRAEMKTLKESLSTISNRVTSLERSRYAWKYWAQRIVPILEGLGARFPPTPEKLEDTDPSMRGAN